MAEVLYCFRQSSKGRASALDHCQFYHLSCPALLAAAPLGIHYPLSPALPRKAPRKALEMKHKDDGDGDGGAHSFQIGASARDHGQFYHLSCPVLLAAAPGIHHHSLALPRKAFLRPSPDTGGADPYSEVKEAFAPTTRRSSRAFSHRAVSAPPA